MTALGNFIRTALIRWQLRSLDEQTRHIVEARRHALVRLLEIRGERDAKRALLRRNTPRGLKLAGRGRMSNSAV
jgi:hypothetical protein